MYNAIRVIIERNVLYTLYARNECILVEPKDRITGWEYESNTRCYWVNANAIPIF
uniref:Uncharacterized protein n=1 Tax=Dulem virus 39 TaxID=3145757 RepID=A0AAU8B973_9CAUD